MLREFVLVINISMFILFFIMMFPCMSHKIMVIWIWPSRYDDSWGEGSVTVIRIVVALKSPPPQTRQ